MGNAEEAAKALSDDDVADPATVVVPDVDDMGPERTTICQKFRTLNSIVCSYKLKEVNPKDPKQKNITFRVCVDLCKEELAVLGKWKDPAKVHYYPMIISALQVVFPEKPKSWYEKSFLKSPEGTWQYWMKVIQKRLDLWEAAHKRRSLSKFTTPALTSVRERIRNQLKQRLAAKSNSLSSALMGASSVKPIPISSGSDSDSDDGTAAAAAAPQPEGDEITPPKPAKKMAPAPDSYSRAEIKNFARMARTIRNYNEENGHSAATANFMDVEFSNNTGRASRCHRSKLTWKRNRFDAACLKTAKILEDR